MIVFDVVLWLFGCVVLVVIVMCVYVLYDVWGVVICLN